MTTVWFLIIITFFGAIGNLQMPDKDACDAAAAMLNAPSNSVHTRHVEAYCIQAMPVTAISGVR